MKLIHDRTYRLLAMLVLLAGAPLLPLSVWAGTPQIASAQQQAVIQSLKQKAVYDGGVRVIVGVALDPSGLAPALPKAAQAAENRRLAVAQAQGKLLQRLDKAVIAKVRRLKHLPFLIMEADTPLLEALEKMPEVVSFSEDVLYRPVLSDSTPLVGAYPAWDAGYTGNGGIIAILDTGVDKAHPFLAGKVVSEACYSTTYSPNNSVAVCPSGSVAPGSGIPCAIVGCDHGTHVAGIAAGNGANAGVSFSGVAKDASLASIQVYSRFDSTTICNGYAPCVRAYLSDITAGLDRAYELKATYGLNIVSANLSLGGGSYTSQSDCDASYPAMKQAIDLLRSIGLATVAAAGNEGTINALSHPGCISSAVSVGATTKADAVDYYSNSSPFLSLLAPGTSIYSSVPGGGYAYSSGTSMAAPHVAGAWALMKEKTPAASVADVLQALQNTGVPVLDTRNNLTKPRILVDAALGLNSSPQLTLTLSADNVSEVYVNGVLVGSTNNWKVAGVFNVPLQAGPNVVAVKATDLGGAAGLLAILNWNGQTVVTNGSWKVSATAPSGWEGLGFNDSVWANATTYGVYGVAPWLKNVAGFPANSPAKWIWASDNQNVNQAYFRFTINVGNAPLAVDTTGLPDGTVGQPYSKQLIASGGVSPYIWSIAGGSLPAWASLTAGGVLSGIPNAVGTSTFTVQVLAANGATDTQVLNLTVLPAPPPVLSLTLSADNVSEVYVNGVLVGSTNNWKVAGVFNVPLQAGPNVVAVKATDLGGAAGLLAILNWNGQTVVTNGSWKVSATAPSGWEGLGFDDSVWANATTYGVYGVAPWLKNVAGFPANSPAKWIWASDNQNVNQAYFRFTINNP